MISWLPDSHETRQSHMVVQCLVLREIVLNRLSTQHKGFSLGPSHFIITCYGSGPSCWWSHRMTSHCLNIVHMMFSLQPSNAQQLPPLSEIMISPVVLQYPVEYKSSPNPFNVSKKGPSQKGGQNIEMAGRRATVVLMFIVQ